MNLELSIRKKLYFLHSSFRCCFTICTFALQDISQPFTPFKNNYSLKIPRTITHLKLCLILRIDGCFSVERFSLVPLMLSTVHLLPLFILSSSRHVIEFMLLGSFFCGMVDRWKVFSLISSRDHCQRFSSLQKDHGLIFYYYYFP